MFKTRQNPHALLWPSGLSNRVLCKCIRGNICRMTTAGPGANLLGNITETSQSASLQSASSQRMYFHLHRECLQGPGWIKLWESLQITSHHRGCHNMVHYHKDCHHREQKRTLSQSASPGYIISENSASSHRCLS